MTSSCFHWNVLPLTSAWKDHSTMLETLKWYNLETSFHAKNPPFLFNSGDAIGVDGCLLTFAGDRDLNVPGMWLMGDTVLKNIRGWRSGLTDSEDKQSGFFQEELNLPRVWTSLKRTLFANTLPRHQSPTASVCDEATPATRGWTQHFCREPQRDDSFAVPGEERAN